MAARHLRAGLRDESGPESPSGSDGRLDTHASSRPPIDVQLTGEDEKTLYVVGQMAGASLEPLKLTPRELQIVQRGMADRVLRRPALVESGDYVDRASALGQTRLKAQAAEQELQGEAYRTRAMQRPGARQLSSGVIIRMEKEGTGPSPRPSDRITVHYEGKLVDGTIFDSSRRRGPPATFPLTGVIPCWIEALTLMKVGERANLVCPAETGFGERGRPPAIPGNATLVFDVELLAINTQAAPPAPGERDLNPH